MIMTIDVGNTNITVGVFRGDEVVSNFRITTKMPRTSDEYGMLLSNLLEQNSISHDDIEDAIIASVVPNVMHSLEARLLILSAAKKGLRATMCFTPWGGTLSACRPKTSP